VVGLGTAERDKEGKKRGVLGIAYISAFVPEENVSLMTAFGGVAPEWYDVKVHLLPKTSSMIAAYKALGTLIHSQTPRGHLLPQSQPRRCKVLGFETEATLICNDIRGS
jgi:hypothetical protein